MKLCANGHQIEDHVKFCPYCGAPAQTPVEPVQPTPVQPAPQTPVQPTPIQPEPQTPVQPVQPTNPTSFYGPVSGTYTAQQPQQPQQPQMPQQPQQPVPAAGDYYYGGPEPNGKNSKKKAKKKKKKGLIITILVLLILIGAVCALLFVPKSPLNLLDGSLQETLHISENYTKNDPDDFKKTNQDVESGYLVMETSIESTDVSFLYPENATAAEAHDACTVTLESGATIEVTVRKKPVYSLKKYFAQFKKEIEDDAKINETGDIQKVTVGDKVLYRMSLKTNDSGNDAQVDRYLESYGKFNVEYTVRSMDGAEGTLRHLIESLYVEKDAYNEPVLDTQETQKPQETQTTQDTQTPGADGDTASVTVSSVEVVYDKSLVTNVDTSKTDDVTFMFGMDDTVELYPMQYNSVDDALEIFKTSMDDQFKDYKYAVTEKKESTTGDSKRMVYYNYHVEDMNVQIYICLIESATPGRVWVLYSMADDDNNADQVKLINTIVSYTAFK